MNSTVRYQLHMLRAAELVEQSHAAYLAAHPECPRYCYTCQQWLNSAQETGQHPDHSIH